MTPRTKRSLLALGAAGAITAIVMIGRDVPANSANTPRSPVGSARAAAARDVTVTDLRLVPLQGTSAGLGTVERNLFRFGERRQAAPPLNASAPSTLLAPVGASGPTAPPAIPLRYIGLFDAPSQAGRVAILSDGRGNVFYGREGDVIEGRYLVLTVSPVSADLSHLNGGGRQTIRLSGQ